MGKPAFAQAPAQARGKVSAADKAHPYAKYLKDLSPSTAERVINDRPMRDPESDAFARAVKNMGGILKAASRAGDAGESILEVIFGGNMAEPWLCAEMERGCGGTVKVEEMRPDLVWFRDGASEILGFGEGLDHGRRELEAAIRGMQKPTQGLIDGKWDAASYCAGLLHGVPAEEAESMLSGVYKDADWTKPAILNSLFESADIVRSDSTYHQLYGMLWDFDDDTRERLLGECGFTHSRDWSVAKTNALCAKAQEIRFAHPEESSIAGPIHALGMACVADNAFDIDRLVKFHGIRPDSTWTAETYDDLTEHVRSVVVNTAIQAQHDSIPSWSDILLGYGYGVRNVLDAEKAGRMSQAAMNLLDAIVPGVEAIHDFQWVALGAEDAEGLDKQSPKNLVVFLKRMQELTQLLINLNDNMNYRLRQLNGAIE